MKRGGGEESHSALSSSALSFLATLGERLTGTSGDLREMSYSVFVPKTFGDCTAFQFGLNTPEFYFYREGPDI